MINVLFCGNDKIFDGILTCALSIMKRSTVSEGVTFYIFTADLSHIDEKYSALSAEQAELLERAIKKYSCESKVVLIDVYDIYMRELSSSPNEQTKYSPYAMFRLFADIVDGMPDKVLYLDADLLFNRDIRLLYDIDIEDFEYASSRDHYGKYLVHPNYINSGVLLLNLSKIRQTKLFEKARDILRVKKLLFPDQSAIRINTTKKKMLPQKFNDQKFLHKSTVVRHFSKRLFWLPYPHTDNIKQWHIDRVHKVFKYRQFDDIFEEYLSLTREFNKEEGLK